MDKNHGGWVAALLALLSALCLAPVSALELGANVDAVVDYSFTLALVDVAKQSRTWGSLRAPWDGNCTVGADGWPAQADCGNVFVTLPAGLPSPAHGWPSAEGVWLVAFQGAADLVLDGMQGTSVVNQSYSAATDTTTLSLVVPAPGPTSCNCIMLGFANASTVAGGPGVKDLRILQPGYNVSQAGDFSTPLLALLQRFSVLRFMDWARTNGNLIEDWANRTLPSSPSYAPDGQAVPWETIFALANQLGKDAWINVPAHASDDYVLQLATLAKQLLAPGLNLYVEWSNEVWNWSFGASPASAAQRRQAHTPPLNSQLTPPPLPNTFMPSRAKPLRPCGCHCLSGCGRPLPPQCLWPGGGWQPRLLAHALLRGSVQGPWGHF